LSEYVSQASRTFSISSRVKGNVRPGIIFEGFSSVAGFDFIQSDSWQDLNASRLVAGLCLSDWLTQGRWLETSAMGQVDEARVRVEWSKERHHVKSGEPTGFGLVGFVSQRKPLSRSSTAK
jgi:hypothetical protein